MLQKIYRFSVDSFIHEKIIEKMINLKCKMVALVCHNLKHSIFNCITLEHSSIMN